MNLALTQLSTSIFYIAKIWTRITINKLWLFKYAFSFDYANFINIINQTAT